MSFNDEEKEVCYQTTFWASARSRGNNEFINVKKFLPTNVYTFNLKTQVETWRKLLNFFPFQLLLSYWIIYPVGSANGLCINIGV